MGLCKRLIARLDIKGNRLIKGVRFEGLRVLGDPCEASIKYASAGIDEILYIDAVASLYGRNSLFELLRRSTRKVFVPITAGGGVRSVEDGAALLAAGADKIAINTAALKYPELIRELAEAFGSQCVVVSIQARRKSKTNEWEAMSEAGRERSGVNALAWIQKVQKLGAGEILLTSVDQDGTCGGPDHQLINQALQNISIPMIVGGGFSSTHDINCVLEKQAITGVSIGAALHNAKLTIPVIKKDAIKHRHAMRDSSIIKSNNSFTYQSTNSPRIAILDYGMGNQQSLVNALETIGGNVMLTDQWEIIEDCKILILPGVGAFPKGMEQLNKRNHCNKLKIWSQRTRPLVGICLGMQMLFEQSDEFAITQGLNILKGRVCRLSPKTEDMKPMALPHLGWNLIKPGPALLAEKQEEEFEQYFVHSYAVFDATSELITYTSSYGNQQIAAGIRQKNIVGFQFHPERSGHHGLRLLYETIRSFL